MVVASFCMKVLWEDYFPKDSQVHETFYVSPLLQLPPAWHLW